MMKRDALGTVLMYAITRATHVASEMGPAGLVAAATLHIECAGDGEQNDRDQSINDIAAVFGHSFGAGTGMPLHTYPLVAAAISASVGGQPPPSA